MTLFLLRGLRMILVMVGMVLLIMPADAEIKAGDNVEIILKGVPAAEKAKVDGRYVVGESGTIRLPLADVAVHAAGLNGEQLARKIEAAYREAEIYVRPTIVVVMGDTPRPSAAQVSVGGQVRRPGPLNFRQGMTVLEALQAAGDLTKFGTRKRVVLKRAGKNFVLDLRDPKMENFRLESADVLIVDHKGVFDRE